MTPEMQESRFPAGFEHLRANLSVLISRGISAAWLASNRAQLCDFLSEDELLAYTGVQARARYAMAWQRRIEDLGQLHQGEAMRSALLAELSARALNTMSVYESYVIELVHSDLLSEEQTVD